MSQIARYARRIMRQYGKHIKHHDDRMENPLADSRVTEFSNSYSNSKGKTIAELYSRRIEVSYFLKRNGRVITGYDSLEAIANGN